ncbi:MAG: hypothetical protein SVW57_08140 [Thermodesulfobacteriota bacterium]|nr:hypothetical protein [Thermodesulfobacteriota bacterium]
MNRNRSVFCILCVLLVVLLGCSHDPSDENGETPHKARAYDRIIIIFDLPGDDFASKDDLEMRRTIQSLIEEQGIGVVTKIGTGMGMMDMHIEVSDTEKAKKAIEVLMKKHAPTTQYYLKQN